MTVVVDTSVFVALLHSADRTHAPTVEFMRRLLAGELGRLVSPDMVLDEGLTLLRRKPGRETASRKLAWFFYGDDTHSPPLRLVHTTPETFREAIDLHFEYYDRGLSPTDCVLLVLSRTLDAPIASLDRGFDGLAPRLAPTK